MADKMIFPIGFDLETAVKNAGDDWDKKYADRLEKLIAKRPVNVKLNLDTTKLDSLDAVKKRLAELKIEPITPATKAAIKELAAELRELARALEAVKKYSSRVGGTAEAVRNSKIEVNEQKAAAARELARQRAARAALAEEKLAQAREKAARAAERGASVTRNANREFKSQDGYVSRLVKRLAVYAGYRQITNFLTAVRDVTAEFELQRVSLGAIIQDQTKANALFSEIKSFALKSPVSILDLTKYTKQLAAYKIGVDELFETTKKLTDVSVGLGVSMDRVVLAYGQTRASNFLRASEIRQFTEMGVPIVEELAAKLSKMNGELVTAAQVMDMVSKRAISFELVKEVFDDMTSAGGMFYNMQEKQGNTLFGLWAKLGDAASVMYDEIGNTEDVNSAMKTTIGLLTELMRNWKSVANTAAWVVAPTVATGMFAKYALSTTRKQAADAAATAATKAREAAVLQLNKATEKGSGDDINAANATLQKAKADEVAAQKAATKTGLMVSGFKSLASSLVTGLGIGLVITAVTTLTYKLFEAYENATRLRNKLDEIDAERIINTEQAVRNFEYLADAALDTSKSVKEQKDKLDELHRTFKDMVPVEDMSIENLRRLRAGADNASEAYRSLTDSVREYIAQQSKQKALGAIEEEFGSKRINAMHNLYDWFNKEGLSVEERSRFFAEFEKQAQDTSKTLKEQIVAAFAEAGIEGGEQLANSIAKEKSFWNKTLDWLGKSQPLMFGSTAVAYHALFPDDGYINDLAVATRKYNDEISGTLTYYEKLEGNLGKYTKAMEEAKKHMAEFVPAGLDSNTFAYQTAMNTEQIRTWGKVIVDALKEENVKIENEWFNIDKDKTLNLAEITSINIDAIRQALGAGYSDIKKLLDKIASGYEEIVPRDAVVKSVRNKFTELANSMGLIDKVRGNMMNATEDLESYRKKINDTAKDYAQQVTNLTKVLAATPVISLAYKEIADKLDKAKELKKFYDMMADILGKTTKGKGADPRLSILHEMVSTLKQVNKEYDDLVKKEGATKALTDTTRIYQQTFDSIKALSKQYKFDLPDFGVPTDTASLTKYLDAIKSAMAKLPKSEKAVLALQVDIEKLNIDDIQKKIEQRLKDLSDRISRTKTAKEFYDKILSQTGDVDLAMNVTMSVYGDTGEGLFDSIVEQIRQSFSSGNEGIDLQITTEIDAAIDTTNQRINYEKLAEIYDKYQNDIIEKNRDTAQKIVSEGQKTAAANILNWEKELAKAKDYEEQRTDIINRETQRRAEIYKSNLPQEEKDRLAALSRTKQSEDLAKVNFEEFTKSEDYIKIFENLDNTSTAALKRLREEMQKLITTDKDLSPENMKTLVKAMEDIDEQISGRGFGNDMVQSVRDYAAAIRDLKTARAELNAVQAEYNAQLPQLDADIATAKAEEVDALDALTILKQDELATKNQIVAAELRLNNATKAVALAEQAKADAAQKVEEAETEVTNQQDKQKKATNKFFNDLQKVGSEADQLANILGEIKELLGISEDSAAGIVFDAAVDSLQTMSKAISVATAAQALFNAIAESNPYVAIAAGVLAVGTAIGSWISGNKIRKANKEIKRQAEILENLQYTYERLQAAADKFFGVDYISNYNQQMKNLQAQQTAYLRQAEAERSKGKKADEEKIKEYENAARDTANEIKKMQEDLTAHFTGTARADAAREFARSWLEAKATFANTADAIKSKYKDMLQNMIVEGAASKVIDNALSGLWKQMDKAYADNDPMKAIEVFANGYEKFVADADKGMETLWQALEKRGIDLKNLMSESDTGYTGIKRDIAGASEESINGLAAGINTQNYYISYVPGIAANVALLTQHITNGGSATTIATGSAGWTDWQTQAMSHYEAVKQNTASILVECRKSAAAAESAVAQLQRVIKPLRTQATHSLHVTIDK